MYINKINKWIRISLSYNCINSKAIFFWFLIFGYSIVIYNQGNAVEIWETCIPRAVGVPYASGPPKWFADPVPPQAEAIYDRIDDPRWKNSTSHTYGSSTTEQLVFRIINVNGLHRIPARCNIQNRIIILHR